MFFCEWFCATGGCLSTNGCLLFGFTENALAFVVKPLKSGLRRRSKEDF